MASQPLAFAATFFPNQDPIGQGLDIGNGTDGCYDIVGVVGNVRQDGLNSDPSPTMYGPFRQDVFSAMWVLVRTDGDPTALAPAARQAVLGIDRHLPAYSMSPLSAVVSESVTQQLRADRVRAPGRCGSRLLRAGASRDAD
jgi:putative ABC transport system permease protein